MVTVAAEEVAKARDANKKLEMAEHKIRLFKEIMQVFAAELKQRDEEIQRLESAQDDMWDERNDALRDVNSSLLAAHVALNCLVGVNWKSAWLQHCATASDDHAHVLSLN